MLTLREAAADDAAFLLSMVAVAADWRSDAVVRSPAAVLASKELARYAADWPRPGDMGLVAVVAEQRIGAAWWRCLTPPEAGYGFVREDVPEVTLGVMAAHRRRGVGASLLRGLVLQAAQRGLAGLSLSVEPDNVAVGLYRKQGFEVVGSNGGALTMLLTLDQG